jgi:hypothetical protein
LYSNHDRGWFDGALSAHPFELARKYSSQNLQTLLNFLRHQPGKAQA